MKGRTYYTYGRFTRMWHDKNTQSILDVWQVSKYIFVLVSCLCEYEMIRFTGVKFIAQACLGLHHSVLRFGRIPIQPFLYSAFYKNGISPATFLTRLLQTGPNLNTLCVWHSDASALSKNHWYHLFNYHIQAMGTYWSTHWLRRLYTLTCM